MKKFIYFLCLINLLLANTLIAQSSFRYEGPNTTDFSINKGLITSLWINPSNQNHILAGSNTAGLWKTTDGGANWACIYEGHGVRDIEVDPSNGYIYLAIGTQFGSKEYSVGLLRSIDGGATWGTFALRLFPHQNEALYVVKLKPGTGGNNPTLLIGSTNGLYIYNRTGTTTTIEHRDYNGMQITDIEFHPNNPEIVYWTGRIFAGGAEIYRTNTFFNSEANITPPFVTGYESRFEIEVCAASPNNVFISYADYIGATEISTKTRIAISNNLGLPETWVQKSYSQQALNNQSYNNNCLAVSPTDPNVIYFGGVNISKSINGANTIFNTLHSTNIHDDIRTIVIYSGTDPNLFTASSRDIVFVGHDGGISKTQTGASMITPGKFDWNSLNSQSLQNNQFHGLGTHKFEKSLIGGSQDNRAFTYYENTWRNWIVGGDCYESVVKNSAPATMFTQGYPAGTGLLSKTETAGGPVPVGVVPPVVVPPTDVKYSHIRPMYQFDNDDLYLGYHNIWKSTDFGSTWVAKTTLPGNEAMTAFDVSKSNPNTAYIALGGVVYNGPLQNIFFKYNFSNNSYIDLTPNLTLLFPSQNTATSLLRWDYIKDIAIDPTDENKILVLLNGSISTSNPIENYTALLLYSNDGGNTWMNYTNGLPQVQANVVKISPWGELFVGSDYGLFYKKNINDDINNYPWQIYKNPNGSVTQPTVIVTDIEFSIDECRAKNVITTSTFGRGIWKVDAGINYNAGTKVISSNTLISSHIFEPQNYYVESGAKLTINSTGRLMFAVGKSITLEKGATLELNGGTIISSCGMWQGVIAEGDPTQPILPLNQPDPNHARVILKNNAKIQYAEVGIEAYGGAFVAADNSNFIDNRIALKFSNYPAGYTTSLPPLGGTAQISFYPYNNPSYAKNTKFTTQTINLGAEGISGNPTTFISIERNKGLSFTNCQFKNLEQLSTAISESQLGNGITATDAGYTVTNCEFYHLNYGVSNGNTYIASFFPTIRNSRFNENLRGILLQGGDVATVVSNTFTIEDLPVDVLDTKRYGLYLKGTHGYEVTNNVFRSLNGVSEGAGCIAWNTMRQSHFIKNNTFNNLTAGVISSGDNTSTSSPPKFNIEANYGTGLKVTCNTFNNTGTNIYVADGNNPNSQVLSQAKGLSTFQGSCLNTGTTVNNLLDLNKNEVIFESTTVFRNLMYNEPVSNNQRYHLQSGKYTDGTIVSNGGAVKNVCLNLTQTMNPPCLTKIYNPLCLSCMKFELNTANSTTKSMVELVDGNNTNGLIQTINDPLKSDVQVRNELLAVSPYLSDEVLLATLNKTTPLHESFVKQIIIPNSPVSENVKPTLDNAIVGFSNGTKNQIIAAQTGVSERTLLEAKVSQAYAYQSEVIYDMARFYLTDSLSNGIDSVIALLENSNNKVYSPWLTKLYIMKHDFVKADAILNDLQTQPEFQDFVKLMQIAKELEMSNRTCKDLTTIEKTDITNVSTSTCNYSKYNAEAWLKYYYNINGFVEEVELPTESFARQAYNSSSDVSEYTESQNYVETNEIPYEKILAKYQTSHSDFEKEKTKYVQNFFFDFNPNPAKSEINLTFFAAENFKTASVEILDMQGKTVITKDLSVDKEQKLELSVETLKSGSYVCKLKVDNVIIETKQLIKQ